MRTGLFVAAAALLSASVAARADDIYTFTLIDSQFPSLNESFTFDSSSILTMATTIPAADLTSVSGTALSSVYIDPASSVCPAISYGGDAACIQINYATGMPPVSVGFTAALTSTGTFNGYDTTLSIEPATSVTPEPSSIVLLGTGLLGMVGAMRRRWSA